MEASAAIVTGGASGIGRAIVFHLARAGCRVGILDVSESRLRAVGDDLSNQGSRHALELCDVSNQTEVGSAVAEVTRKIGPIDILVNCAGIVTIGDMLEQPYDDFDRMFRVNVGGIFTMCQAVVPSMVDRRTGKVLNVSSWLGKRSMPSYGGYAATKAAIISMTQTLALEVAESNVRVNAVCPGVIVDTGMREEAEAVHLQRGMPLVESRLSQIPLGRFGTPDDVAKLAVFLLSENSGFMTGQAINVSGGQWLN